MYFGSDNQHYEIRVWTHVLPDSAILSFACSKWYHKHARILVLLYPRHPPPPPPPTRPRRLNLRNRSQYNFDVTQHGMTFRYAQ